MSPIQRQRYESLVREHHERVYKAAFQILRDEDDARDVTQEVFLSVLEERQRLDEAADTGRVLRWLAAKRALMLLRSARRRRQREDRRAMDTTDVDRPTPELDADDAKRLWTQVARLPEELRRAIVLRFQEGMTFEAMGATLSCSGPTAHDRVRRGLERLRAELPRLGLAGIVPSLESALRADPTVAIPTGLQTALLSVGAKSAVAAGGASLGTLVSALVVLVVGGAGAWLVLDQPGEPTPREVRERPAVTTADLTEDGTRSGSGAVETSRFTDRDSRPSRAASNADADLNDVMNRVNAAMGGIGSTEHDWLPPATPAFDGPRAVVVGRVLKREGGALAEVSVTALSEERGGKFPRYVVRGVTDVEGNYRLEVPAPHASGQNYQLRFAHSGRVTIHGELFEVRPTETVRRDDRVLDRSSDDAPGDVSLDVKVIGPDGNPIPSVTVSMWRIVKTERGTRRERDGFARTGPGGEVTLRSGWIGRKVLIVDPRRSGYMRHEETFHVGAPGAHQHVVVMRLGLVIAGTLVAVDGEAVTTNVVAWNGKRRADVWCAEGRFRLVGLEPGEWRLRFGGGEWSLGERHVMAGTENLTLRLKRANDPTDRGEHMGELHGTIADAVTGQPPKLERWGMDVDVRRVPDELADATAADLLPRFLSPLMAQRAATEEKQAPSEFHQTGLESGTYVIDVRRPGYAPCIAGPFKLEPNQLITGIELRLERPAVAVGRVLDPSGAPLKNAFVFATGSGPASDRTIAERAATIKRTKGRGTQYWGGFVRTNDSGRFELGRLPASMKLCLVAVHADHATSVPVPVDLTAGGESAEITLRMR